MEKVVNKTLKLGYYYYSLVKICGILWLAKQIQLFKSLMWRNVVEKTYKHKPIYLVAKEESEIKGVLPLFLM